MKKNSFYCVFVIIILHIMLSIVGCSGGHSSQENADNSAEPQGGGAIAVKHDDLVIVAGDTRKQISTATSSEFLYRSISISQTSYVGADMVIPDVPYISQFSAGTADHNVNCGPASYLMVRAFHRGQDLKKQDLEQMIDWMATNIDGYTPPGIGNSLHYNGDYTDNVKMKQLLEKEGDFFAEYITADESTLRAELSNNKPVLVVVTAQGENNSDLGTIGTSKLGKMEARNEKKDQHWMVVVGIDNNYVYVNDPGRSLAREAYARKRGFTIDSFMAEWKRIEEFNNKDKDVRMHGAGFRVTKRENIFNVGIDVNSLVYCPNLSMGNYFSMILGAVDGIPPYSWSIIKGALPPGLNISNDGVISGTPSQQGVYEFTVAVKDSRGDIASRDSGILVDAGIPSPSIVITTATNIYAGKLGSNYQFNFSAAGGSWPYLWSVSNGGLPPGLALTSAGVLYGIPSVPGTYLFGVRVASLNSQVQPTQKDFQITVCNDITVAPTIAQTPMSVALGTTITEWGTGFTPSSTATLHFKKPDGAEFPTLAQSIKADGSFSITYTIPTDRTPGIYTWWGVDSSGKVSNAVSYTVSNTITQAINPTVAMSPMTAKQGDTVSEWGAGFTPSSTATLHFKKPDGTEFPTLAQTIKADGSFSMTYTIPTDRATGTYTWWGVDSTGKVSNTASYTVTQAINPTVAVSPQTAKQGDTLSEWGTGFTPSSTATLHFKKPDGTEFPTLAQTIKADGSFSMTYTIPTDRATGTYTWWGVDSTGKVSNTASYTVTQAINPTVAVSPQTAKQGDTLSEWGTGFTPSSTATLHFKKPDGTEFPTLAQTIKADGSFSMTYTIPTDRATGTYTWWGVDSTGKVSNTASYTVTQAINPTVAVSPQTAKQGDTLSEWGTGFTPSSTATLHFKKPDGTEFPTLAQTIKADGSFSMTYTIPTDRATGTYTWWGVDSTGKVSNTASYTVTQAINPTVAMSPMTGAAGTTFSEWGTGFTPNSTSTLHFKKPDGTEYPTATQVIDGNGTFSISYPSPTNKPAGTYSWWAVDVSGKVSNTVSYTITVNPVIAQTPMSGHPGTTFSEWGTGFTPNSTATLHFKKPDGTEYPTAAQPIDGNGTFSISYTAPSNKPTGTYSWWGVDGPTGRTSNSISYVIN